MPPENWSEPGEGAVYIIPADGGEPRRVTSESDAVYGAGPISWSPGGTLLTYFSRDEEAADWALKAVAAEGGQSRIVAELPDTDIAWSPDGRRIAYKAAPNKIKIISIDDESTEEIVPDLKDVKEIYQLDWSPDGKTIVFGGVTGGGSELWLMGNFLSLLKAEGLAYLDKS